VFYSCEKTPTDESVKLSSVAGLVEKGPFISGSSVSIYELDNNLNGVGRVFETKTDNEGAFLITTSTSLVSQYVKLSVSGFYFNEYTGKLSDAPIVLESLADISQSDKAKININILTHLEATRVLKLVSGGMNFQDAKQQAQKELLNAFLITEETVIPEQTSITDNDISANILIAISSILLNGRSDAQFSEFMSEIRNDLSDGAISNEIKTKIAKSSLGLNYTQIKEHIKKRYAELGKTVEIGAFELFIDGDGDGQIGDPYDEIPSDIMTKDSFSLTERDAYSVLAAAFASMYSFVQNLYLFDGVYTNSVGVENSTLELQTVYAHNLNPNMNIINELWMTSYQAVNRLNQLIYSLEKSEKDWATKYVDYARVYRAYIYLNMINLWGDVPLVIVPPSVDNLYFSRTPQSETLSFIISELENVYPNLPEKSLLPGCSKYFAKSIQARAYLHGTDYSLALNIVTDIIRSGKYILNDDLNAIYAGNTVESIFELPNHQEFSTIWYRNLIQKGAYAPVSQYAEILLTAAEANYRTGNAEQALTYLNQIKKRNGLENISSVTEEDLLNAWQNELKNEGLYFFTLKRFGKATQILNVPEYKLLLPIPYQEIVVNPNMTQNPGW
jgi:hypothetical protein